MISHDQLLFFSLISRLYRSVLHVESRMLKHRHDQKLNVTLFWLHCLNLISTVSENVSRLKNSKLDQNDNVLRIINSAFVQTVNLQICFTCQEQNSQTKMWSKTQHCIVQLLICLTVYTYHEMSSALHYYCSDSYSCHSDNWTAWCTFWTDYDSHHNACIMSSLLDHDFEWE